MLIGLDWGGTKIEAAALSEAGDTLLSLRVLTPRGDYEGCVDAAVSLVREIEARLGGQAGGGQASVGVGIPGGISRATGLVRGGNSTWLNGRPLGADLSRALGRPVRVENDANCFAVSEAVDGAGAGAGLVWGVILGTGTGSGLALGGRALAGRHGIAGEWGHNPLPWPREGESPGPACWCGRHGCIETFTSGTGLAAEHQRRTGRALGAEAIVAAMREGEEEAGATFAITLERIGRAMAHVVNLLDPDVIVLGGGLSNIPELAEGLPARIAPYVFAEACTTPVLRNRHGDASGVRGAAWLWRD